MNKNDGYDEIVEMDDRDEMEDDDEDHLMDDMGYPSERTLERIQAWPAHDGRGLIAYICRLWLYDAYAPERIALEEERADPNREMVSVSTAGWSGHEDILAAMKENQLWWMIHWYRSSRGGHYIFSIERDPVYKIDERDKSSECVKSTECDSAARESQEEKT